MSLWRIHKELGQTADNHCEGDSKDEHRLKEAKVSQQEVGGRS